MAEAEDLKSLELSQQEGEALSKVKK